jgi:hypothetical protein
MELLVVRCAGLDVAKDEVVACVRVPDGGGGRAQVRTFQTFTSGLEALAAWLAGEGVTQVVMEATGQYWKPIWYVLEEAGFELLLVNARHVKILPAARPMSATPPGWRSCWSTGCCGAASCPPAPSASCATGLAIASFTTPFRVRCARCVPAVSTAVRRLARNCRSAGQRIS